MSKNIVERVATRADISKVQAKEIVDLVFDEIAISLKDKEDVNFYGFGKFSTIERKARNGRNPSTGEAIKIKASTGVKFKPSGKLKEAVKAGKKTKKK